jgi:FixJ family two-component response regulator
MKGREPLVFVVDDDKSVRTSLSHLLESDGYLVESFVSAAEYLARKPHPGPACLILDVLLPDLDGLTLQRELNRVERSRSYLSLDTAIFRWVFEQ